MALLVMVYMALMSDWESAAINGYAHPSVAVSLSNLMIVFAQSVWVVCAAFSMHVHICVLAPV